MTRICLAAWTTSGGDGLQLVDGHHAGDLSHQPLDEPEVAADDLLDGTDGLGVIGVAGIECLAELVPVLGEHGRFAVTLM
jgi:hypothetical protein